MSGQSNNNEMRAVRSRLDFPRFPPPSRSPTSSRFSAAATSASCRWISSPRSARTMACSRSLPPSSPSPTSATSRNSSSSTSPSALGVAVRLSQRPQHLRTACSHCGHMVITDPFHPATCSATSAEPITRTPPTSAPSAATRRSAAQVRPGRVRRARHDLLRSTQGHYPPQDLRQGRRDRRQDPPRYEGAGGLLRRHPAHVAERHLHRQRDGTCHCVAASPLARRLLRDRQQPQLLPRQDHPYRGSWVEFEYDQKNTLYVRIDRKRKFLGTIFLRALGLRTDEEILRPSTPSTPST